MSGGQDWGPDTSPWEGAPLHEGVEYDPLLRGAGDVIREGESCMGLGDEEPMPATPTTHVYLGDEGPKLRTCRTSSMSSARGLMRRSS